MSREVTVWWPGRGCVGWALQMRWLWLKKTQPDRSWASMSLQVHPNVAAMFRASVVSTVGDGNNTSFWMDRWLQGESLATMASAQMGVGCLRHLFLEVGLRAILLGRDSV